MHMKMKKIVFFISALMIMVSCGEKGGKQPELTLEQKLCTEWHSTAMPLDGADIYLSFGEDNTFELYQKIVEGAYRLYRGTWSVEGNLLTGKYNDGEDWGASYNVTVKDDSMTLTSNNEAAQESTFDRCSIPEEVKDTPYVEVKGMPAL